MQDFHRQDIAYAKVVDRYSRYIESPVLRLKFLNNALKVEHPRSVWNKLPLVGSLPDRAMIIVELSKVLPVDQPAPLGIRLTAILYRVRYAIYAMCATASERWAAGSAAKGIRYAVNVGSRGYPR